MAWILLLLLSSSLSSLFLFILLSFCTQGEKMGKSVTFVRARNRIFMLFFLHILYLFVIILQSCFNGFKLAVMIPMR